MARSRKGLPALPRATGANAAASLHLQSTPSPAKRGAAQGHPSIATGGVIIRLGATDELELELPSGQTTPVAMNEKGMLRIFRILTAQKSAARPLTEARTGDPEVPTIAYQEHLEKHVLVMVPHSAPGCAFCARLDRQAHDFAPKGAALSRDGEAIRYTKSGKVATEVNLADLGLDDF